LEHFETASGKKCSWFLGDGRIVMRASHSLANPLEGAQAMSKGMNSKKQTRKAPAKSLLEKRAEKKAKKTNKGAMR
jgi:hypothetical protein